MEAVVVMRSVCGPRGGGFAARPGTGRDPSSSTSASTSTSTPIYAPKARNRGSSTPQTSFLHPLARNKTPSFGYPIFYDSKPIIPSAASSSSSSLPEVDVQTTHSSHLQAPTNQSKTVHVKFVLHKACLFGQKFLIVGDNPIFGLWDPSKAVPLEWSHGHIWTTELDLPVGEPIRFKFILQCTSGEIVWQPGPDRVLQTWETNKTIVILEDWEKEEDQKIIEDEPSAVLTDKAITEENKSCISGKAVIDKVQDGLSGKSLTQHMTNEKKPTSSEDDLVLVPGLVPTSASTTATAIRKELSNGMVADVSTPSNGADDCSSPQLSGQQEESELPSGSMIEDHTMATSKSSQDVNSKETLNMKDDAFSEEDSEAKTRPALRNDNLWGRETLQQLLLNLGFPLHHLNDNTS